MVMVDVELWSFLVVELWSYLVFDAVRSVIDPWFDPSPLPNAILTKHRAQTSTPTPTKTETAMNQPQRAALAISQTNGFIWFHGSSHHPLGLAVRYQVLSLKRSRNGAMLKMEIIMF